MHNLTQTKKSAVKGGFRIPVNTWDAFYPLFFYYKDPTYSFFLEAT